MCEPDVDALFEEALEFGEQLEQTIFRIPHNEKQRAAVRKALTKLRDEMQALRFSEKTDDELNEMADELSN